MIALAGAATITDVHACEDVCTAAYDDAFKTGDWDAGIAACEAASWLGGAGDYALMRRAWLLYYARRFEDVVPAGLALRRTRFAADGWYLAGLALAQNDELGAGEPMLWGALMLYVLERRRRGVASASCALVRAATTDDRFDDALTIAPLCLHAADRRAKPDALRAVAEAEDLAGRQGNAINLMIECENTVTEALDVAWCYHEHAQMLLDRRSRDDDARALRYLDDAAAHAPARDRTLAGTIAVNRAIALARLGRDHEAADALAAGRARALPTDSTAVYQYVEGVLAIHAGDVAGAERMLVEALASEELDGDVGIDARLELAAVYRRTGRTADADVMLAAAIADVESLRAASRELRPWILARRTRPYLERVALLAAAGRADDALATLEALHARAWLEARRERRAAAPPPSVAELRARLGDHEVIVLADDGDTLWRAHVAAGVVRVEAIAGGAAALRAFADHPDDAALAALAARAAIPDGVAASDQILHVVASGALAAVPFAALVRDGRFLVEDRAIARLPGLVALECHTRDARGPAVVIGPPDDSLPAATGEVRELAAQRGVPAHTGAAATVDAVLAARDAALLHVAVHGVVRPAGGALELADGTLDAARILAARLAPRRVVLAGCATGASADAETWGALASAFLAAGTEQVIATTRAVDDDDAAAIMRDFHARGDDDAIRQLAATQRTFARTMPPSRWATWAAWGSARCDPSPR